MKLQHKISTIASTLSLAVLPSVAQATNGMLLEGYGARSSALGGASAAYDSGNSAAINNPATLILLKPREQRFGLGLRNLRPDVSSDMTHPQAGAMHADSSANSYYMPSISYIRRTGELAYGIALTAQGGMGTTYKAEDFLSLGTGVESRSELSVGGLMLPLAYRLNEQWSVGGSLIFTWAGMDMQMAADANSLQGMMTGGSMQPMFQQAISAGQVQAARFDFGTGSPFSGAAKSSGLDASFGVLFEPNDKLKVGAYYRFKTALSDMEGGGVSLSGYAAQADGSMQRIDQMSLKGKIKIIDFQWPAALALGVAYQARKDLMLVADLKQIFWADVMEKLQMRFEAYPEYGGGTLDMNLPQHWDDQTVLSLGAEYWMNPQLALRGGINLATSPVPDEYVNPLFPAIVENHYSLGLGYLFGQGHEMDFAMTYAPKVSQTNAMGITSHHAQWTIALNYAYRF